MEQSIAKKNWFIEIKQKEPYIISILYTIAQELNNLFALYIYFNNKDSLTFNWDVEGTFRESARKYSINIKLTSETSRNLNIDVKIYRDRIEIDEYEFIFNEIIQKDDSIESKTKTEAILVYLIVSRIHQAIHDSNFDAEKKEKFASLTNNITKWIITLSGKRNLKEVELLSIIPIIESDKIDFLTATEFQNSNFNSYTNALKFYLLYYNFIDLKCWNSKSDFYEDIKYTSEGLYRLNSFELNGIFNYMISIEKYSVFQRMFKNEAGISQKLVFIDWKAGNDIKIDDSIFGVIFNNPLIEKLNPQSPYEIYGHGFYFYADIGARIFNQSNKQNNDKNLYAQIGSLFQLKNPKIHQMDDFNYKFDVKGTDISDQEIKSFNSFFQKLYSEIFDCVPAHPYILMNSYLLYTNYILTNVGNDFALKSQNLLGAGESFALDSLIKKKPEYMVNAIDYSEFIELGKNVKDFGEYYGLDFENLLFFSENLFPKPFFTQTRNHLCSLIDFLIFKNYFMLIEFFVETYLRRTDFFAEEPLYSIQIEQLEYLSTPIKMPQGIMSGNQDYVIYFPYEIYKFKEPFVKWFNILLTGGFYIIIYEYSGYSCLVKSNETPFLQDEFDQYKKIFDEFGIQIAKDKKKNNLNAELKKQCEIISLGISFNQLKGLFTQELGRKLFTISDTLWKDLRKKAMERKN